MIKHKLLIVIVLGLLGVLAGGAPFSNGALAASVPFPNGVALSEPAFLSSSNTNWDIQCVECPKRFSLEHRSLRLDSKGHPHIAYGGENLYYAWHDGVQWHYETADNAYGVGDSASLALDGEDQ
ncbi:MAG: hypothetical protein JW850_07295 [Thermoflexales bacterium]|nr:hypothetical protein [Thermoflexales bacterium]